MSYLLLYFQDLVEIASRQRVLVDPNNIELFINKLCKLKKAMESFQQPTLQGLEDIVHDASLIRSQAPSKDISWLFGKLFPPRRRTLFPIIKDTESDPGGNLSKAQNARLTITVIGANNVLMRKDHTSTSNAAFLMSPPSVRRLSSGLTFMSSSKQDSFHFPREELETRSSIQQCTSSFVRIRFRGQSFQTKVDYGDSPLWEQAIEVPLFVDDEEELTPIKLKEIEECIEISLHDKVKLDFGKGGGYYEDEETTVEENRFLGFVEVPFPILNRQDKVFSHFILNTPDFVLGYEQANDDVDLEDVISRKVSNDNVRKDLESQQNAVQMPTRRNIFTSLKVSMSMEPKYGCDLHQSQTDHFPSNESLSTIKFAREWMHICRTSSSFCKERDFNVLVLGLDGKTWLIHRLLNSQAPPSSCRSSLNRCAHFVSLIPTFDDWSSLKSFKHIHDVWLPTTQTCLDILAGNRLEHAVLLANYFMFLNGKQPESSHVEVYLAIGSSSIDKRMVSMLLNLYPVFLDYTIAINSMCSLDADICIHQRSCK